MPSPYSRFLSTPSARRATRLDRSEYIGGYNFYPRPPRGGRRDVLLRAAAHSSISIHALREEGDAGSSCGASCRSRFLSTPSARRATGLPGRSAGRPDNFYPRPPRGGRQVCRAEAPAGQIISIHALREEGDTSAAENLAVAGVFLSTPSARRATRVRNQPHRRKDNFYPRPPRGGRHCRDCQRNHTWRFLSTPSARRATAALRLLHPRRPISIHALREEGDYLLDLLSRMTNEFLSTPSARRATLTEASGSSRPRNFYPRPPRGGRLSRSGNELHPTQFLSTPSARRATGSPVILFLESEFLSTPSARRATTSCRRHSPRQRGFLSTPSARRATGPVGTAVVGNAISIHALREEGDTSYTRRGDFSMEFLSTPSARRATRDATTIANGMRNFYPRPPRGGRQPSCSAIPRPWNFYPRPPRGGRQPSCSAIPRPWNFYPRPPRGGRRLQCLVTWSSHRYFYPRPPRGGRPRSGSCTFQVILFLSTPSARRATSTRLSRRIPF